MWRRLLCPLLSWALCEAACAQPTPRPRDLRPTFLLVDPIWDRRQDSEARQRIAGGDLGKLGRITTPVLSEQEQRCPDRQCAQNLAHKHDADYVLGGEVQSASTWDPPRRGSQDYQMRIWIYLVRTGEGRYRERRCVRCTKDDLHRGLAEVAYDLARDVLKEQKTR